MSTFTILVVLIVVAAILLTIVVLLQNSKGEGLATNFAAANQALGVRQAANYLEKVTWSLVAFILVLSIASTFMIPSSKKAAADEVIEGIRNNTSSEEAVFNLEDALNEAPSTAAEE